jgi:site-specific recombinase XerD
MTSETRETRKEMSETPLASAFEKFEQVYMPLKFKSSATRRGYSYDVRHWMSAASITYASEISIDAVLRYFTSPPMRNLKATSLFRKIAAVRAFFLFLEGEDLLGQGVHEKLITPKVGKTEPRPLSQQQYTALLREAATSPRDYAIIELALQTGIRLSELTGLRLEDLDLPQKPSPTGDNGYGLMRITRKRGKTQELIVNYKACRALIAYMKTRSNSNPYLFLNKYGETLTNRSVEKMFKKYAIAAGVPWAYFHTLRTTHITMHLALGTDVKTVQTNAGHSSIATTNVYAGYVKTAQVKAMQTNAL